MSAMVHRTIVQDTINREKTKDTEQMSRNFRSLTFSHVNNRNSGAIETQNFTHGENRLSSRKNLCDKVSGFETKVSGLKTLHLLDKGDRIEMSRMQSPSQKYARPPEDKENYRDIPILKEISNRAIARRNDSMRSKSMNDVGNVKSQILKEKKSAKPIVDGKPNKLSILNLKVIGPYRLTKTIGSGSTSKVRLGIHEITREKKAIKIIPRRGHDVTKNAKESIESREARIYREAALLSLLYHPNIVGMSEMLTTPDMFCLFFDYVDGEQLLEYVIANGALRERTARRLFTQLLSAVSYCHENSVVHRDLKIENVMIDRNGNLKLIDFGLSNFYDPNEQLKTFCGSLYFAAPELLSGKAYIGPEVDVWSLGVIIFVLLVGQVPFDDKNIHLLHEKIKAAKFEIPPYLSTEAKNLIKRMIVPDPKKRITLDEVLVHPWVVKEVGYINNFVPERHPFDSIEKPVHDYLKKEFSSQFEHIDKILQTATKDWTKVKGSPIISLYFLVKEKLKRQQRKSFDRGNEPAFDMSELPLPPPRTHHKHGKSEIMTDGVGMASPLVIPDINPDSSSGFLLKKVGSCEESKQGLKYFNESINRPTGKLGVRKMSMPPVTTTLLEGNQPLNVKVKSIFLRGLFSYTASTAKTPTELYNRIIQVLNYHRIENRLQSGVIFCRLPFQQQKQRIQSGSDDNSENSNVLANLGNNLIAFEICIVKAVVSGNLGIQFKKCIGDSKIFKQVTSSLTNEIN